MKNHLYILSQLLMAFRSAYISPDKKFLTSPSKIHGSTNFRKKNLRPILTIYRLFCLDSNADSEYKRFWQINHITRIMSHQTPFIPLFQLKIGNFEGLYFLALGYWAAKKKSYNRSPICRIEWGGSQSETPLWFGDLPLLGLNSYGKIQILREKNWPKILK